MRPQIRMSVMVRERTAEDTQTEQATQIKCTSRTARLTYLLRHRRGWWTEYALRTVLIDRLGARTSGRATSAQQQTDVHAHARMLINVLSGMGQQHARLKYLLCHRREHHRSVSRAPPAMPRGVVSRCRRRVASRRHDLGNDARHRCSCVSIKRRACSSRAFHGSFPSVFRPSSAMPAAKHRAHKR